MSIKLNTEKILTNLWKSLLVPAIYEILVLAYYMLGMHRFGELHSFAWTPTVINVVGILTIIRFLYLMRNKNYRKYD